jgi:hypothetical protein
MISEAGMMQSQRQQSLLNLGQSPRFYQSTNFNSANVKCSDIRLNNVILSPKQGRSG